MPCGDMNASRAAPFRSIRPESDVQRQVRASARVSGSELAATHEKNLSTPQSSTQTHARLSRKNGDARGAQCPETPSRQGPETACDYDTTEAARLTHAPGPRFAFHRTNRLHRRAEFLRAQRTGVRVQTDHFVVYAARFSESQAVRLGTTVSRRVGNAVMRNRIKRRVRECFRLSLRLRLPEGTDLVVISRAGTGVLGTRSMRSELETAVAKLRLRLKQSHE
jgi:ribonuclease P protein component